MAILEINNVEFSYQNKINEQGFLLSIPKWHVNRGSFFSIIGPNGCGKSTLLKLIARIYKSQKGTIKINGKNIDEIRQNEYSKIISYVPQSNVSIFPFSVYEIVMMGRTPYMNLMGFDNKTDREKVDEALDTMALNNLRNKSINEISGGEVQRVFIARALAQQADIILLDEPSSHLDLKHQMKIFDLLTELCENKGITIIAVTHDLNLVGIYSKELIFMNDGTIIIAGNKKIIFTKENILRVFNINTEVIFSKNNINANVLINPQS